MNISNIGISKGKEKVENPRIGDLEVQFDGGEYPKAKAKAYKEGYLQYLSLTEQDGLQKFRLQHGVKPGEYTDTKAGMNTTLRNV